MAVKKVDGGGWAGGSWGEGGKGEGTLRFSGFTARRRTEKWGLTQTRRQSLVSKCFLAIICGSLSDPCMRNPQLLWFAHICVTSLPLRDVTKGT